MLLLKLPIAILKLLLDIFLLCQNRLRIFIMGVEKHLEIGRNVKITPLSHFKTGRNVAIADGAILECGGQIWCNYRGGITIGNSCYIGYNSVLLGGGGIEIGDKVLISPGAVITSQGHFIEDIKRVMKDQPTYLAKIIIEDDVWIGANACILPGTKIGRGSVIGGGSVVDEDIPEYSIVVGIPAKVIKRRG